jgi:hypothetical protein
MKIAPTTPETSIQQVAIERAIKLLIASKAWFSVRMPDGSFIGNLVVATKPNHRKIKKWRPVVPSYNAQIKAMQISDGLTWELEYDDLAVSFLCTASSQGSHFFGKVTYTTAVKDRSIEAMRME